VVSFTALTNVLPYESQSSGHELNRTGMAWSGTIQVREFAVRLALARHRRMRPFLRLARLAET